MNAEQPKTATLLTMHMATGKIESRTTPCTDFSHIANISGHARHALPHCDYCHEEVRRVGPDAIDVCTDCGIVEGNTHDMTQCEECNDH